MRLRLAFPSRHGESILASARPGKHQEESKGVMIRSGSVVSLMTHRM
jgi:hypothetical protein